MQTTGIFTCKHFQVPSRYGETIYLLPVGDIHYGSPQCDFDRFERWCKWAARKSNAYLLGMGDYMDIGSASERLILKDPKMHDSTAIQLEGFYKKQAEKLARMLSFAKGRVVGLIEGNHYGTFKDGTTTTQYLCNLLDCQYLGVSSFVSFEMRNRNKHGSALSIDIWAHHGKAGGRLAGATINSVGRMMDIAEADIYLCGHDHQKGVVNVSKLRLVRGSGTVRVSHRKILLGRTGSFLKGYEEGVASYVVDAALRPSDLGTLKIEITPRRSRVNGTDLTTVDIHASV